MYKYGNSALKKLKNRVNSSESPAKDGVKFAAKQGAKEVIKKAAGKIAAKVFGTAGMILTPTTVYAGGDKTPQEWEKIQNPETVNFKNPSTGEIKSVRAADADAFSNVPEFKDYVRQDG